MPVWLVIVFTVLFISDADAQSCSALKAQLANVQARSGAVAVARVGQLQRRVSQACNSQPRTAGRARPARRAEPARNAQPARARRGRIRELANTSRVLSTAPRPSGTGRSGGNLFSNLFGRAAPDEVEVVNVEPKRQRRSRSRVERVSLDPPKATRSRRAAGASGEVRSLATRSASRVPGFSRVGNSRTVCVRLCDGFYFPINSSSHSDNYYDELAMCVGRCPGADVSLYAHNNGSPVESMRSTMTGEPYVALPTAFDYRRKVVPGCGCRAASTMAADMTAQKALSYVGLAPREESDTMTDATAAAAGPRWTPMKAVYDGTGEPLELFPRLGIESGRQPKENHEEEKRAAPMEPQPVEERTALSEGVPLVADTRRIRSVGPQFYGDAIVDSATAVAERRARPRAAVRSTAVRLVPLVDTTLAAPAAGAESAAIDAAETAPETAPEPEAGEDASVREAKTPHILPVTDKLGG